MNQILESEYVRGPYMMLFNASVIKGIGMKNEYHSTFVGLLRFFILLPPRLLIMEALSCNLFQFRLLLLYSD